MINTMSNSQIQIKISLSPQLNSLLKSKAKRIGVPVTQLVKYIVIRDVEKETYPEFTASEKAEQKAQKALKDIKKSKVVTDIHDFFERL